MLHVQIISLTYNCAGRKTCSGNLYWTNSLARNHQAASMMTNQPNSLLFFLQAHLHKLHKSKLYKPLVFRASPRAPSPGSSMSSSSPSSLRRQGHGSSESGGAGRHGLRPAGDSPPGEKEMIWPMYVYMLYMCVVYNRIKTIIL